MSKPSCSFVITLLTFFSKYVHLLIVSPQPLQHEDRRIYVVSRSSRARKAGVVAVVGIGAMLVEGSGLWSRDVR